MITCENMSKKYRGHQALSHINIKIKENTITGVIGRNGAGKTTLLKLIAGYYKPTKGTVHVWNRPPFDQLQVTTNTIFIDDQLAYPDKLTLNELLEMAKKFYPNWDMGFATKLFQYFELREKAYHHQLSKGKRQAFNTLIGLAARAPLTIFDEPVTGMDLATRKDFYRVLLKDYLTFPRTILLSSHHLNEMEEMMEDILLLDEGEVVLHQPIDDMREYAIGITGNRSRLDAWIQNKEVLHKEVVGMDELYIVIKNDVEILTQVHADFQLNNISPSDLAVYITEKQKGGIDHVFYG